MIGPFNNKKNQLSGSAPGDPLLFHRRHHAAPPGWARRIRRARLLLLFFSDPISDRIKAKPTAGGRLNQAG